MNDLRRIDVAELGDPLGPYHHAVVVGSVVYVAGQAATAADGTLIGDGDFVEQARQVYRNLDAVLQAVGGSLDCVAKMTVFLTEMANLADAARVRREFMAPTAYPASTVVEVARLPDPRFLIEIEAIAHLPASPE